MDTERRVIPRRQASSLINSLKGGVVPRTGLPYITVGRKAEIEALLRDVDIAQDGGASFRFIVGKYGSGKSFLLQTIRSHVMDRGFVVVDADLTPERRLQGTRGQGLSTYRELMRNMSTKTRPEGGALPLILDRWIQAVDEEEAKEVIAGMNELVHGFDFASVLMAYYEGSIQENAEKKANALKWLRGEYPGRGDARRDLGVNAVISDDDWYDYIKLFALFMRRAGYQGLLVLIDELVNIYKIPNAIARQYNYEKILTMYNDALQGKAAYMGIIMSGTPQCVEDRRRGIYSYEALRSRLQEGRFSREGARDMLAPVIRLEPLTAEEMLVLSGKLAEIHAVLHGYEVRITDEDLASFIKKEYERIGADINITPREVIRDLIELLDILFQHPGQTFEGLLSSEEYISPGGFDTNASPCNYLGQNAATVRI